MSASLARRAAEYRRLLDETEAYGLLLDEPADPPPPPAVVDHLRRIDEQMSALAAQLDAIPAEEQTPRAAGDGPENTKGRNP